MRALPGQQRQVRERVAVDHDHVGMRAGGDHADLASIRHSFAAMWVAEAITA